MRRLAASAALLPLLVGCGTASHSSPAESRRDSHPAIHSQATAPTRARASTASWRLAEPSARQALVDLGGNRVLLAGGMLAGDESTPHVRVVDLSEGASQPQPPLAVPVHDAAGGRYAGDPAVFGGGNSVEQSLVQSLRGGRWSKVDRFPTTRSDLSAVQLGSGTLILGGYDGSGTPTADYLQRGSGSMRPFGQLVRGVRYAATAVGRGVYVFGGEVDHAELDTVQRVDTATGRTSVVARLPHPLGHAMAAVVGDRVLLVGGHTTPDARTAQMWWFDPATHRFTRAGWLPRPLSDAAVTTTHEGLRTSVWLLGGEDPSVTDRVVRIDVG